MIVSKYEIPVNIYRDLKFLLITDIHNAEIRPICNVIEKSDAHGVLFSGDFIHDSQNYMNGLKVLKFAARRKPTLCSLGNHERKFEGDLPSWILKTGAVLLDNCALEFEDVYIGGLSSGYGDHERQANTKATPQPNLQFLSTFAKHDGYKILLSHHPEYYPQYIKKLPIDLTLSGHAHGGQWRFFGQGIFSPGQGFFPKYTSGFYENRLIVSRGLGDSHAFPPRIFNQPEIIEITLRAQEIKKN